MRLLKTNMGLLAFHFFNLLHADVPSTSQVAECSKIDRPYRVTARHIEPKGIGYNHGYTTLEGFVPLYNGSDTWMPFLDLRSHIFNNGKPAINTGLGIRYLAKQRIWGVNTYYDYRKTKRQHYNQVAFGLESLGSVWDVRINGYIPVGTKQSSNYDTNFYQFQGNSAILQATYEYALGGFNAEGGIHVDHFENFPLYFTAGTYYLTGKAATTWGGQLRGSVCIFDHVKIDANVSYDHLFKWIGQGQVGLNFSFGHKKKVSKQKSSNCSTPVALIERRYQSVERFEIIPVDKTHTKSEAINPSTGSPYQFIFVDNTSASLGTFESPYHSLASAEESSSPYDILYIFPGDGTTANMDQGITLQPNQKLWGSSLQYPLPTTVGVMTIPQMSSSNPQITNTNLLGYGVTLATNNEISGITFTETSGHAIYGEDPLTFSLSNCTISNCGLGDLGLYPVALHASSPLTANINNNNFIDNPNAGTYIQLLQGASSNTITMNNNTASGNEAASGGGALMTLEGHGSIGTCTLVMKNNVFENNECYAVNITDFNSPQDGSFASFEGIFDANIFAHNTQGITYATNADTCLMSIKDNDLSNNTNGSIFVGNGLAGTQFVSNATVVIDSNQINQGGAYGDAITISPAGDNISITVTNNSIKDNIGTGLVSYFHQPGPNLILSVADNIISNNLNDVSTNASSGISIDGYNSVKAQIENNTFSNNTGTNPNSIGFYGTSFDHQDTSSFVFLNNVLTDNDTFLFGFYGLDPETGCLTIQGNVSTSDPAYSFQKQSSGMCFIVPCNYETANTGGFDLSGVTESSDCSGSACP